MCEESFVELSARFDEIMPFRCKAILLWLDTEFDESRRNFIVAFRQLNSIAGAPMLKFMHKLETGI